MAQQAYDCLEGPERSLHLAIVRACISGRLAPAEMRTALYCSVYGYVQPRYLDDEAVRDLSQSLGVSAEWFRKALIALVRHQVMVREREDRSYRYALNPRYRFP